jgi:hypothetical protein
MRTGYGDTGDRLSTKQLRWNGLRYDGYSIVCITGYNRSARTLCNSRREPPSVMGLTPGHEFAGDTSSRPRPGTRPVPEVSATSRCRKVATPDWVT